MSTISILSWRDDDIRLLFLKELQQRIGDFILVGAHARDLVCRDIVGLPREMPRTSDLDIAISILAHGSDYEDRVATLDGGRFASPMRFAIPESSGLPDSARVPIDVIPYGSGVADPENIPLDSGRSLDATGMAEAAACSITVRVHERLEVRVPPLHALIALKLIAYGLRAAFGEYKDARIWTSCSKPPQQVPPQRTVWLTWKSLPKI